MEEKIKNLNDSDTFEIFHQNYSEMMVSEYGRNIGEMKRILIEDIRLKRDICFCGLIK